MNDKPSLVLALLLLAAFNSQPSAASAQGTAFSYQGELDHNGSPASGTYNLTFSLFNTNTGGEAMAGPITNQAVNITNGLFSVLVDFGPGVFTGETNWLEIGAESSGAAGFTTLAPRQLLAPTPYALTAANLAGVAQNDTIAANEFATVSGGTGNTSSGPNATVGGGFNNTASGYSATVGGGEANTANNSDATVGGGDGNTASGEGSTVAGGVGNTASGDYSFAAGYYAQASDVGSFVWSDESGGIFSSTGMNQFCVRATGGVVLAANVQIGTSSSDYHRMTLGGGNSLGFLYGSYTALGDGIHLGYNYYADAFGDGVIINSGGATSRISAGYGEIILAVGGQNAAPLGASSVRLDATLTGVSVYGTFNNLAIRNAKQNFAAVDSSQILDKVVQLPVSAWSYKLDPETRHIGPVAQDFYSVFDIGTDNKHIAPMDEGGVAMAAIQGLNQKLNAKDAEIQELKQSVAELKKVVENLSHQQHRGLP